MRNDSTVNEGMRKGKGLPAGFVELGAGRVHVWVKTAFSFLFDKSCGWRKDRPFCPLPMDADFGGRDRMLRVSLDASGKPCGLIRHYRRGGIFRHVLGDSYLGKNRFFQEVRITEWARTWGVPTVEVLALRTEGAGFGFYRADLMTREIEDAKDLDACLNRMSDQDQTLAGQWKKGACQSVACLVHRMHAAGLFHVDLNLKNILLRQSDCAIESYVIDLDKAKLIDPLKRRQKMKNLLRLYRSAEKLGHAGKAITLRDLLRFVRIYCRDDRKLEAACRKRLRKVPFSLRVHRFFWRLFGNGGKGG